METPFDLAIIGGGVNGCGIARDAAGRGLKVLLCEQNDLASGASCATTKLMHGGLRHLENHDFGLVREALAEREVLWGTAPHVIWPLRFVLPLHDDLGPAWMLRLKLLLHDHLGGRKRLAATRTLDLTRDPAGRCLKPGTFPKGLAFADCWVDDSRLVVLNARGAADRGATILTRTKAIDAERRADDWLLTLQERDSQAVRQVRARVVVNAAGPWVGQVLKVTLQVRAPVRGRLVQGSHIVVPRLEKDESGYMFQSADGHVVFAIPFEEDFTLIGTTDRPYRGDPADARASAKEIDDLCEAASHYLARPVLPADVVWSFTGVRPLFDSLPPEATRDHALSLDAPHGQAPVLSIFGGRLATYRRLAEKALRLLIPHTPALAHNAGWTERSALPGGDFPRLGFEALVADLQARWPFLRAPHARRLARNYGTAARVILGGARALDDLGRDFGADLWQAEVDYLIDREWARASEDILWRRTKLGLTLTREQVAALGSYVADRVGRLSC